MTMTPQQTAEFVRDAMFGNDRASKALGMRILEVTPGHAVLAMTVREAVTNIQRHAQARSARVDLRIDDGEALLRIDDDGCGGARDDAFVPGNGLIGMRERVEALGGRLLIDTGKGEGTRIEVRVPLAAHATAIDDPASGMPA